MSNSEGAPAARPVTSKPSGRKVPGRNGFQYRPQYGLIIQCRDEADQSRTYGRLHRLGYKLKVVCV